MPSTKPPTDFLVSVGDDGMVVVYRVGAPTWRPRPSTPAAIGYGRTRMATARAVADLVLLLSKVGDRHG